MMPDDDYPHPLGLHVTENREREARASLAAPAGSVVWTDKTPKKRGYYWWRLNMESCVFLAMVQEWTSGTYALLIMPHGPSPRESKVGSLGGLWSQELQPPNEKLSHSAREQPKTMSNTENIEQPTPAVRCTDGLDDFYVIAAMIKYGGGFVRRLGEAARHADDENMRSIKSAWPDYWAKYTEMAAKSSNTQADR